MGENKKTNHLKNFNNDDETTQKIETYQRQNNFLLKLVI